MLNQHPHPQQQVTEPGLAASSNPQAPLALPPPAEGIRKHPPCTGVKKGVWVHQHVPAEAGAPRLSFGSNGILHPLSYTSVQIHQVTCVSADTGLAELYRQNSLGTTGLDGGSSLTSFPVTVSRPPPPPEPRIEAEPKPEAVPEPVKEAPKPPPLPPTSPPQKKISIRELTVGING